VPTESLMAQIYQVINSSSNSIVKLSEPLQIQITKTPVYAIYPLIYQQVLFLTKKSTNIAIGF